MNIIESIAESKIKDSIQNGEFDNNPCSGKKINLREYFKSPPHLRAAYDLLKNSNVLPDEIQLTREIYNLNRQLEQTTDTVEIKKLKNQINIKTAYRQILIEKYHKR